MKKMDLNFDLLVSKSLILSMYNRDNYTYFKVRNF